MTIVNFFPHPRSAPPDNDLGLLEPAPRSEPDTDLSKKIESPFSQELSAGKEKNILE